LDESTVTEFDDWLHADVVAGATKATTLIQFGSSADSHWVIVLADSEQPIDATIAISRADREPFYTETVTVTAERYAGFRFMAPGAYTVSISTDDGGEAVSVSEGLIDCNRSRQIVRLQPNGELSVSTLTEQVFCG
jgi:hypothetical protein